MISKETFIDVMHRLQTLNDNMDAVDSAFAKLSPDFCGFFIPDVFKIIADILNECFNDEGDYVIEYCIYELDFLRNYKPDRAIDKDGNTIDLSTWDKVYDYLISNKEVKNENSL